MSFVKSILQQWRERSLKRNAPAAEEPFSPADIPACDTAEVHLLEALARQINEAVNNGMTISSLNIETTYEQLAESLDRFKQESLNTARNEVSEQWSEEESRRLGEIKNLQGQNAELQQLLSESQKRYAGAERLRKTLSERIHDLENQIVDLRNEYERDIEEKLRQINKIKARSLGLSPDGEYAADSENSAPTTSATAGETEDIPPLVSDENAEEENGNAEKIFDCRSVDEGGESDDTVVIKHRYASLYAKLNKAQNALHEQRKENRIILKRDTRHRQRIEELQTLNQSLRKEVRRLTDELEQTLGKKGKKPSASSPRTTAQGLTSLLFEEDPDNKE